MGAVLAALLLPGARTPAQQAAPPQREYGPLEIRSYELREHRFEPPAIRLRADGSDERVAWGWQIVVHAKEFPIRALDPFLWIDDVRVPPYERVGGFEEHAIAFNVFDPALLRSEHVLQIVYGGDERTRTRLVQRLDPEKLVRLPDAERKALGIPDLESFTLTSVGADGAVAARGRLDGGVVRLAVRGADGVAALLPAAVALGADGTWKGELGALPRNATALVALRFGAPTELRQVDLEKLPKGVELLDSKPIAARAGAR